MEKIMDTENKYLILEINKVYLNHLANMMKKQWSFILKLRNDNMVEFTLYDLRRERYATISIEPQVLLDDRHIDAYIAFIAEANALPQASIFEILSRRRVIGNAILVQKKINNLNVKTIVY